jgi:hypothetical protein
LWDYDPAPYHLPELRFLQGPRGDRGKKEGKEKEGLKARAAQAAFFLHTWLVLPV